MKTYEMKFKDTNGEVVEYVMSFKSVEEILAYYEKKRSYGMTLISVEEW